MGDHIPDEKGTNNGTNSTSSSRSWQARSASTSARRSRPMEKILTY